MKKGAKIAGAIIWFLFCGWFLSSGKTDEAWGWVFTFLKTGKAESQSLSWETVAGFVSLILFLSIGIVILSTLITRKKYKPFLEKWKKLLDLSPWLLFYDLVGRVASEEIFFRWFPLTVLLPLWETKVALWGLIAVSCLAFGILHVHNQEPGKRSVVFTIPQIAAGIIFSYIFLAFGFLGAVVIHLAYDTLLFSVLWIVYRRNHAF